MTSPVTAMILARDKASLPARHRPSAATIVLSLAVTLCACASYAPAPLSDTPDLATEVPRLTVSPEQFHLPGVEPHPIDPSRGLDMTGVAILAVANNPQLRVERAKLGTARAQLFQAGLLPDPQLGLSAAFPTSGPAVTSAFSAGLTYVLDQVITRQAVLDAAGAEVRSVDLDGLWQEWQVAQQVRLFFTQVRSLEKQSQVLQRYRSLYTGIYERSARALTEGNVTLDVTGTNLVALLDVEARYDKTGQDLDKARHQLRAALGLAPDIELPLVEGGEPKAPSEDDIRVAGAQLTERRPDLLALKAGYESQEAKVRQAILAQFPTLGIGFARARDNTGVYSNGPSVVLGLPIFNGNRGNIAIEQATRARLRAEYQARIDDAFGEVDQLRVQHAQLSQQLARVEERMPFLNAMADKARRAYAARDLAAATYLQLEQTLLNQEIDAILLQQNLLETRIALQTLLGMPISDARSKTAPPATEGKKP